MVFRLKKIAVLCLFPCFIGISTLIFAQNNPKNLISFQGKLEQNGIPATGDFSIQFTLWGTGWFEVRSVKVTKGLYAVNLGELKPIPDEIFEKNRELELEIRVNGAVLAPRVKIVPVPFSYKAETVAARAIKAEHIQNNAIEARHLAKDAITVKSMSENTINSSIIVDNSIMPNDLASQGGNLVLVSDTLGKVLWVHRDSISLNLDTKNVKDNSLLTNDLAFNSANMVLTTDRIGKPQWQTVTSFSANVAQNIGTGNNNNTFVGAESGVNTVTNNSGVINFPNTFLGYQAGYANTTGAANTFIGYRAGYSNTTAWSNTFVGFRAGWKNTTGAGHVFMGDGAGFENTTGLRNFFVGWRAGNKNTTGYDNHFEGYLAGYSNTIGYYNTFIGYASGYGNTSAHSNTFLGNGAGYKNTTGNENLFKGIRIYNASLNRWLLQTPIQAIVKEKVAGNAGSMTANTWITRNLSVKEDPYNIVTLSGNQFTLPAGRYYIEAGAPAYMVNSHIVILYNTTSSQVTLEGTTAVNNVTFTVSYVFGYIDLAASTTFELRHRSDTTRNTDGLGFANINASTQQYSFVKITKLE